MIAKLILAAALGCAALIAPLARAQSPVPAVESVTPGNCPQGQTLTATVVGENTHFAAGKTVAQFGSGITVNSVSVIDPTHAAVSITIPPGSSVGAQPVTITTGAETAAKANAFTILPGVPVIQSVSPGSAEQGQSLAAVTVVGQFTHFVKGQTKANFGPGITVDSMSVVDPTHADVTSGGDPDVTSTNPPDITSGGGGGVSSGGDGFLSAARFATGVAPAFFSVSDPSMRRTDLMALHPIMREATTQLLKACQTEGLPFRLFEAYRSPLRQSWLYGQGRPGGNKGPIVTNAQAWQSYHQYGLAADFVLWLNGQWSWSTLGVNNSRWRRLHELSGKFGLEPLQVEAPHLQIAGLEIDQLQKGKFPGDGDNSWRDNLEGAIISWHGKPAAPPMASARPQLPAAEKQTGAGAS